MNKSYLNIVKHYEDCLEKYGDTYKGVDWPNKEDTFKRFDIMLQIISVDSLKKDRSSILDFGCGTAHLLEYLIEKKINNLDYSGLDLSAKFIDVCRNKFPDTVFQNVDVIKEPDKLIATDYTLMNGVFTEKRTLTFEDMFDYFSALLKIVFLKARRGVAFNVMSKNVDWERDDLFHLSHDRLSKFLVDKLSRNYVIRNDYGLFEYTVYLFK